MKLFAITVFAVHTIFELLFGLTVFLNGASSSQTAEEIARQSDGVKIAFRFMGSALFSLGVLGAITVFFAGVQSITGTLMAIGFLTFHVLGTLGSLWSAMPSFEVYASPFALAALVLHGLLAVGFMVVVFNVQERSTSL
jgi:hypothetical protein